MHDDEVEIRAGLVERLLAAQFPRYAGLPVTPVRSAGTVNAIYRLGDDLCVRLPRVRRYAAALEREWRLLPELAPRLPLRVPAPVALGEPDEEFPSRWAVYGWIDGRPYEDALVAGEITAAADLARFVVALRQAPVADGAPRGGRRPLRELDAATRPAIDEAGGVIDRGAAAAAWDMALEAPGWDGRPAWIHADLLRPNLLVSGGRLGAVIDWGSAGAGDPAFDVVPAWSVFGPAGRAAFRAALGADEGTWRRARGYALHQAALIIPYYAQTNPGFAAQAARTVGEVIEDSGLSLRSLAAGSGGCRVQAAVRWRNSQEAAAKAATRMTAQYAPAIHASWPTAAPVEVCPIHSPRMVSITNVNGWFAATGRSTAGMVRAGTNAVLRYGMNMSTKVAAFAASGLRTSRPNAAASHDIARMNAVTTATAATQAPGEPVGRQPTPRPAPITSAVARRLRARLATMWPARIDEPWIGMERNRSTMPLVMSTATATAVVPAPNPAHSTIRPGTT
jgi:aminoglycoside phosphotransferase (APT) family kinase protein